DEPNCRDGAECLLPGAPGTIGDVQLDRVGLHVEQGGTFLRLFASQVGRGHRSPQLVMIVVGYVSGIQSRSATVVPPGREELPHVLSYGWMNAHRLDYGDGSMTDAQ